MYAAGIVLYNPEEERLKENINAIGCQVDYIVLVDNGSKNIETIKKFYNNDQKIAIIENHRNNGIAAALNQIMKYCAAHGTKWVLTLDQDSVCPDNMIGEFRKYVMETNTGIICPWIRDRNDKYEVNIDKNVEEINQCITSGSLVSVAMWKNVGKFDEKMFIDMVDFEFCARVKQAGYRILRVNSVQLLHECGNLKVVRIGERNIQVTNHSPIRCYYYAKNVVYCHKKLPNIFTLRWKNKFLIEKILKILLFEQYKSDKLKAVIKGWRDGKRMLLD